MTEIVKPCSGDKIKVKNAIYRIDHLINRVRNEFEGNLVEFLNVVWNGNYYPTISDVAREFNMKSNNSDSFMLKIILNLQCVHKLTLRMNSAGVIKIIKI